MLKIYESKAQIPKATFGIIFEQIELDSNLSDRYRLETTLLISHAWIKRLIIELDGGQHSENKKYDMERTAWLNARGFKVLGFWNHDVLQQTESIIEVILQTLGEV